MLAKFPFTFRGYAILQAADSMFSISHQFTASWTLPRIVLFLTFMTASAYTQRALKYCACAQNVSDVIHGLHILRCWHTPRRGVRGSQVPRLRTECVRFCSLSLFVAMCCYLPSLFVARCCYLLLFTVLIYCYLLLFTILIYCSSLLFPNKLGSQWWLPNFK